MQFRSPSKYSGRKTRGFSGAYSENRFSAINSPPDRNRPRNSPGVGGLGSNFKPDTGQPGGHFFQKLPEKSGFRAFSTVGEGTLCSTMFRGVADVRYGG